ncbi:MAG TPA: hypothetical protein VNG90_03760, partial [Candidatus Acidoferrum sp.]|nr:hypothetical protein [Candidatus Acidoferrum sp.]
KIASDNGYKLTYHPSPYSYIDWYNDEVGKKSTYPGFDHGNVRIGMDIYSGGNKLGCEQTGKMIQTDASHIGIVLSVGLPSSIR